MKITGQIKDIIPELLKLDMNTLYVCEVKQPKSKRSLQQNRLLWKLIHSIAKETAQDDLEVYCAVLERAVVVDHHLAELHLLEFRAVGERTLPDPFRVGGDEPLKVHGLFERAGRHVLKKV